MPRLQEPSSSVPSRARASWWRTPTSPPSAGSKASKSGRRSHGKLPKAPDSCLILTDIVGATPSNIAESMLQADNTAVLSGLNLPMVLTALVHRDEPLSDVVRAVSEAGIASAAKPALRKD